MTVSEPADPARMLVASDTDDPSRQLSTSSLSGIGLCVRRQGVPFARVRGHQRGVEIDDHRRLALAPESGAYSPASCRTVARAAARAFLIAVSVRSASAARASISRDTVGSETTPDRQTGPVIFVS
jgi:hypothetical protein